MLDGMYCLICTNVRRRKGGNYVCMYLLTRSRASKASSSSSIECQRVYYFWYNTLDEDVSGCI